MVVPEPVPPPLSPGSAALVRVSAAQASRDGAALKEALAAARSAAGRESVEEVLLQSYLFLGFPAAIWAFAAWRSLEGPEGLAAEPAPSRRPAEGGELAEAWLRAGEGICRRVYGADYEKLRGNVRALHPELDHWMILEGYGKVLSRPELDLQTRELCVVACLAVTGWEPQLHSHLRGALNAGASSGAVEAALETGLQHTDDEDWEGRARALWARVLERHVR